MGAAIRQINIKTSEREFRQMVMSACKLLHWSYYFTWNSKNSVGGFPDLVLIKIKSEQGARNETDVSGELIFVELKTDIGKLTPKQVEWLSLLKACGCETYLWRPSMWDEIIARLQQ